MNVSNNIPFVLEEEDQSSAGCISGWRCDKLDVGMHFRAQEGNTMRRGFWSSRRCVLEAIDHARRSVSSSRSAR